MNTGLPNILRRTLLLKVISKPQPTQEDVSGVIELTASKVAEALEAQAMTLYLVEGKEIVFKHVYYSPSLWEDDPEKEREFETKREKLLQMKIPIGTGVVGKVVETGEPVFFSQERNGQELYSLARETGFKVTSMLTVPLKTKKVIGAIQVLNKEPGAVNQEFVPREMKMLMEVAEYSSPLIHRMLDPNFQISDTDTAKYIARYTGTEMVSDASELEVDGKLVEVVGEAVITREGILPYKRLSPTSVAALMTNPLDLPRKESFQIATELHVEEVKVAPASLIDKLMEQCFGKAREQQMKAGSEEMQELAGNLEDAYGEGIADGINIEAMTDEDSAPIIKLANRIVEEAFMLGASDIHIEPQEKDLLIRYRIDGRCEEKLRLPKTVSGPLTARVKIMSNLDIAEKRLPQDGRIVFKHFTKKNIDIDLRVATGPMNFGEKIVMRILDKTKAALPITALGFSNLNLEIYRRTIRQPYGMILHCGPTGSGKSMTLFSALREIANPEINIQTAEDPIEYTVPGINQMQMHRQIGLTFARALRCYLRMDPDVILVGEIRDTETAEIAIEAALTGHLLLSTLHTNDAPSTIARFSDMNVEPFMISASLLIVCAQRLMRRVCKDCREAYQPEEREKELLETALGWSGEICKASEDGCPQCGGRGMKGRIGIHELMVNNDDLTSAINREAETAEIKRIAMRSGMKTLHQDSMLKVKDGDSTIIEALTTVPPDMTAIKEEKDEPVAAV